MNYRIRVPEVRVVDSEGNQLGIMETRRALSLAQEQGLDLVEIAPTAQPPVCKILDYGK
ncbi:MAG TPA: translation initiation factor IF-3, partial [Armatimonadota bacterium]|nr:translation initiation factor IF-3 [Armatimonadota bacterium]